MDAMTIAKYIITKCYNNNNPVSNLKLQKMLYFIFGDYYKKYKEYLFEDDFVAWKLGPVILEVYFSFNSNISNPICESYDVNLGLAQDRLSFIDKKIDNLQAKSTWELVEDSHKTTPWKNAFSRGKGNIIESYDIAEYFEAEKI